MTAPGSAGTPRADAGRARVARRTRPIGHPFDSAAGTIALGVALSVLLLALLRLMSA